MNNNILNTISLLLGKINSKSPLIHHITNYVTVNDCANVILAIGASPIMADDIDEVKEITAISSALVINIGTLNSRTVESMIAAGKCANELNIPVVFDPVGAGASNLRNDTVKALLEQIKFSAIRGNLSEIRYITGLSSNTKGVDVSEEDLKNSIDNYAETASLCAKKYRCTVGITGENDFISDGNRIICIQNGNKMLGKITGTGCMCTSLVGACCGTDNDFLTAVTAGILFMGIAGEIAYEKAGEKGYGSFHMALIDEISTLNTKTVLGRAKIYETGL